MNTEPELLNERLERLAMVLDEIMPNCALLVRDAIELLKEKEAVEPIPFFTETGAKSPNYVICGHCKSIKAIMPKHTKQKYCHECGFPVLWEGQ